MKKIIYTLVLPSILFLFGNDNAKAQAYGDGSNVLNLGVGFGYYAAYGAGSATPVFSGTFEHEIAVLGPGKVGIGVALAYQADAYSYSDYYGDTYKDIWHTTYIGVRGTWHPDVLVGPNYDCYAGLQLGYYDYGYTHTASGPYVGQQGTYTNPLSSTVLPSLIIGGRYYFTPNIGGFAELGWDIAYLKIGVAINFGGGR